MAAKNAKALIKVTTKLIDIHQCDKRPETQQCLIFPCIKFERILGQNVNYKTPTQNFNTKSALPTPQTQESVAFHTLAFSPWHFDRIPFESCAVLGCLEGSNPKRRREQLLIFYQLCTAAFSLWIREYTLQISRWRIVYCPFHGHNKMFLVAFY